MLKKIPHTYTIIFSIILLCAVLSWIIPAGEYTRHTRRGQRNDPVGDCR